MTIFFYLTLTLLALLPAVVIPRSEWDVKLWFFAGGAVWLLFMLIPVAGSLWG